MSWWQWKALVDSQRDWERQYYALPPDACPNDGSPLELSQESQLGGGKITKRNCPMGDYTYTGGTRIT